MTPEKIVSVVEKYEREFRRLKVHKIRMDAKKSLAELNGAQLLGHAHYLCDGIKEFAQDPERQGKTGRHLGFLQAILSMAGWYTLEELQDHNRP